MCQVHTGACVSLLVPGKTDYTACHPRKTTTYTLHIVPITTHTQLRAGFVPGSYSVPETAEASVIEKIDDNQRVLGMRRTPCD